MKCDGFISMLEINSTYFSASNICGYVVFLRKLPPQRGPELSQFIQSIQEFAPYVAIVSVGQYRIAWQHA